MKAFRRRSPNLFGHMPICIYLSFFLNEKTSIFSKSIFPKIKLIRGGITSGPNPIQNNKSFNDKRECPVCCASTQVPKNAAIAPTVNQINNKNNKFIILFYVFNRLTIFNLTPFPPNINI